jgi:hypothetical protein
MNSICKEVLSSNRSLVLEELEVSSVLDLLQEDRSILVTQDEAKVIRQSRRRAGAQMLLTIIERRHKEMMFIKKLRFRNHFLYTHKFVNEFKTIALQFPVGIV